MNRPIVFLAILTLFCSTGKTQAAFIVNGGFETGDFTGWTVNAGATGVSGNFDGFLPHTGNFFAFLGHVGTPIGSLSQTITTTTAGDSYTLSMYLGSDGATPNQFVVAWNGTTLYDQSNLPNTRSNPSQYNLLSFTVVGTGNDVLTLRERNDPAYLALDDVSLVRAPTNAVPEPTSMALLAMGGLGMAGIRFIRRRATAVVAN